MQFDGSQTGFDSGVLSPFFYGASSVWLIAQGLQEPSLLAAFIKTIPGIFVGLGAIFQGFTLYQHRLALVRLREKELQNDLYIQELKIRAKQ